MMKTNKAMSGIGTGTGGQHSLGLYIHVPFCLQKCHYCDFYSEAGSDFGLRAKYTDALCREIRWYGGQLGAARCVDTIFIGGGTPSILEPEQTAAILDAVRGNFPVAEDAEITMECNPATLTAEKLAVYRKAGINRLSMGVQSMDPGVLKIMGRAHGPQDVLDNFRLAREAGFDNINLDVMFGVPGQDMNIWKDTVHKVLAMEPEHLSFYSLELAEGTEFYRRLASGVLTETAPEDDRKMYHWLLEELDARGYGQYEISNAARPGRQCRHNLKYWNMEDYLGLGAAAHSFIGNRRFSNPADVNGYVESLFAGTEIPAEIPPEGRGLLLAPSVDWQYENTWHDSVTDCTFTALRRVKGIGKKDFEERFGREFWDVFAGRRDEFQEYVAAGDAAEDENGLWITRQGMDIASRIIALFV